MKKLLLIFVILFWASLSFAAEVQGPIQWPMYMFGGNTDSSFQTIDGTTTKLSFACQAPYTGDITTVYFYIFSTTTGDTLKVSLQDPDQTTAGFPPDGTIDQSGTVVLSNSDDNIVKSVTLNSARSVTVGDWLDVVIEYDNRVSGTVNIGISSGAAYGELYTVSYYDGSAWAQRTSRFPVVGFGYSDGTKKAPFGAMPPSASGDYFLVGSDTSPDEIGNVLTMDFDTTAIGVYVIARLDADFDIVVYDSSDTALKTVSVDKDVGMASTGITGAFYFSSPLSLSNTSSYRIVVKPTTTSSTRVYRAASLTADTLKMTPAGDAVYSTSRTDAGSWTDDATKKYYIGFILKGMSDLTGSGGGGATSYGVFR